MQDVDTKKDFSIGALSEAAGVTTRTIRYYVAEGLLAPPQKGGRGASYTEEHLSRLNLIKRMKEEYLPLHEIAALLRGLDGQAVLDLLKQKEQASRARRSSAKSYLKDLLEVSSTQSPDSGHRRAQVEARPIEPAVPDGAEWRRLVVADGVELHVRADRLVGTRKETIRRLFQFARELFRR